MNCSLVCSLRSQFVQSRRHFCDAKLERLEFGPAGQVRAAHMASAARVGADMYVVADGIHSRAKRALFPDWTIQQAQVPELVGPVECAHTAQWGRRN